MPQSSTSQVAGYPGTGGRMLLEWVAEYSGMRSLPEIKAIAQQMIDCIPAEGSANNGFARPGRASFGAHAPVIETADKRMDRFELQIGIEYHAHRIRLNCIHRQCMGAGLRQVLFAGNLLRC